MHAPRANELTKALRRVGSLLLLGAAPALAVVGVIAFTIGGTHPFYDFVGGLWEAGRAILHGHNPYHAQFLHRLAQLQRAGGHPSLVYSVPVYPAPTLIAMTPLAWLPARTAGLVFAVISIASMAGGLRLLGVRDWRCYGAVLLSWPALQSIRLGALEPLLLLGLAVLWRFRRSPQLSGPIAAFVAAAKLFLWPVAIWLALGRRWHVLALAAGLGGVATLLAWALISFAGISGYPAMLGDVNTLEAPGGVSLIATGLALGVSRTVADAVALLLAAAILVLAAGVLRRERDEARALGLAVVAALVASPVVWAHYLTLLYVPIALLSPELSLLWLVPLATYLSPVELTRGSFWAIAPYLILEAWVLVALCPNPHEAWRAAVRLPHGLRSTSFRSYIAAQRPTKGPQAPY